MTISIEILCRMMWAAGILASLGSITYPAISAFVSIHSDMDTQGVMQGMVTGMRGLCNGLGPAMFGVIFYLFHVDLNDEHMKLNPHNIDTLLGSIRNESINPMEEYTTLAPGPPFGMSFKLLEFQQILWSEIFTYVISFCVFL